MNGEKAKRVFEQTMDSNMITDEVLEYHDAGPIGIELSTGGFMGNQVWGVTIAILETGVIDHDRSRLHQTLEGARRHIEEIKNTYSC